MNAKLKPGSSFGFVLLAAGIAALLWAYWPNFLQLWAAWDRNPQYSHGFLVPVLAAFLLYHRYHVLDAGRPNRLLQPTLWGAAVLVLAIGLRIVAAQFYIESLDHLSLLPAVVGLVLLTGGWHALRWSWPAVLFLGFMIPLPYTLETMMREPLRSVGTAAGTFLMQTLGLPAFAHGHQHEIIVGGMSRRIGVAEACSGLSMLMIFFAIATAAAVIVRRSIWEKVVIVLSAVPIALLCNILRITATGAMLYGLDDQWIHLGVGNFVLFDMSGPDFASSFFHDWAGWLMMPMAILLLWGELAFLKRLLIRDSAAPLPLGWNAGLGVSGRTDHSPRTEPATDATARPAAATTATAPGFQKLTQASIQP